ncbi:MAG: ABC transporter permease [Acidobacteria bacterium]|nr:ABC transporter permease [Acidobacteriota bacterium]
MDTLLKDVIYAGRGLRKNPGFATVATLTIALGIGACTAIFSVVNAVLLRPLPYSNAQRLVIVWGELRARNVHDWPFSPPDFRDLQLQTADSFDDIAAVTAAGRTPLDDKTGEAEQIRVGGATPNLFRVLGARILLGRDFTDDDATPQPQAPPGQAGQQAAGPPPARLPIIAILSHGFWTRRWGGDPGVIGRNVDLGQGRAQIVGVLAPEFELLFPPRANIDRAPDIWTAVRINYETANRNNVMFRVIGRLKPGVTLEQASMQADRLATDLRKNFAIKQTAGLYFHVVPMYEDLVSGVRPAILSLMGAVGFVLLIACANVANLLVVRASARSRELAVRAAIGASRGQLVRQMLAESLVIASMGTVLGLGLARAGIQWLIALGPKDLPRLDSVHMDPIVLSFAALAGLVTAVLCGVVPALRASRTDLMDVLREAGGRVSGLRGGRRLRQGVVIVEVALSFILLIGAGLMLRSIIELSRINPGYDANNVLTFFVQPQSRQPGERQAFMQQVRQRVSAIPGVLGVTAALPLPLDGQLINGRYGREAAASDPAAFRQANYHAVLPGYFETMRTRLIAGRLFTDADNNRDPNSPKQLIIDDLLAARAFPNESPVGKRLLIRIVTPEAEWADVIGVVAHQRHASLADPGPEAIFITDSVFGHGAAGRWAVRTSGDPNLITAAVRAAIAAMDPRVALAEVQPMSAYVEKAMAPLRFTATLIGMFAVVAMLLAGVGLYGVLSTIVRMRTAEIGLRMVFGAESGSILGLVVGEGLKLSAGGMAIGLAGALAITRVMASMLVGIQPTDPVTFGAIAVLFWLITLAASWIPAFRASRLDPMAALREE